MTARVTAQFIIDTPETMGGIQDLVETLEKALAPVAMVRDHFIEVDLNEPVVPIDRHGSPDPHRAVFFDLSHSPGA